MQRRRSSVGAVPWSALVATALVATGLVAAAPPAAAQFSDATVDIIKEDEYPSNAELAVRLSEETPLGPVPRVLVSRDDEFADALASGYLQSGAPLLLVPSTGPVPQRVLTEINRLRADEALVLGGTAAVSPETAASLQAAGLDVDRRFGASRFETAVDIAQRDAPTATTAILARAFPADPAEPTQGFADALAAGGMAAQKRWPVLLSDTAQLNATTREYLTSSSIEHVIVVGGTAAISQDVEDELRTLVGSVERLAGANRFQTAVEIADKLGEGTAADLARVVLVNGTSVDGWAGGFAAASHAAATGAPILLVDDVRVPPETEAFLEGRQRFAQEGGIGITCVVHPLACEDGRRVLGLPTFPLLDLDPPPNGTVEPGQVITARLTPPDEAAGVELTVKGSCVGQQQTLTTDAGGAASFPVAADVVDVCVLDVVVPGPDGDLTLGATYLVGGVPVRTSADVLLASDVIAFGDVAPEQPVYVNDDLSCTSPDGATATSADWAMQARYLYPDGGGATSTVLLSSAPVVTSPQGMCTARAVAPPEAERVLWGLYSWSDSGLRRPLAVGSGTTATFDLAALPSVPSNLSIVWLVEMNASHPSAPQPQPPGTPGYLDVRADVGLQCDGVTYPQGQYFVAPGATCAASTSRSDLVVLVLQPDVPNQIGPSVDFTIPSTVHGTTVSVIAAPEAFSDNGSTSCATAEPLSAGFIASSATTAGEQVRTFGLELFADEEVRVRMDALSTESGAIDPLVRVYQPDGSLLAEDDDGGEGFNSLLHLVAPVDGTYCVEATGFGGSTGDFLLSADLAPFFTDSFATSPTEPGFVYDVELFAGSLFVAEMRAPEGSATDPLLRLYDPAGNLVAQDDDGGGYPHARIEFFAPADGPYVLEATVYQDRYGPYDLALSEVLYDDQAFARAHERVAGVTRAGAS